MMLKHVTTYLMTCLNPVRKLGNPYADVNKLTWNSERFCQIEHGNMSGNTGIKEIA